MKPVQKQMIGAGLSAITILAATQVQAEGDWEGSIGAGVFWEPEYLGSSESTTSGFPMFELTWRDRLFIGPGGIGGYVFNSDDFKLSAAIGYDEGRKENDSTFLRGLGDIDGGITYNLGLEYEFGPVTPYLEVTKYGKGSEGLSATIGVEGMMPLRALTGRASFASLDEDSSPLEMGPVLTAGISADWGNDDFNGTYYGVTAAQSAASGLGQYTATSGFHAINLDIGIQVPVTERFSVGGMVTYSQLTGDAKDSTIVRDTSGTSVGLFGIYRF
ncbi:MipA/OmpV family protein [Leisingera sp. ANG-M1]|uniref:MipA/OmpV family protein n=1 Tax=Leisingera sp. ANG-M1 TaxID=1577895 RepID=UPI00068C1D69|nr:MipA/OmpV family protein [Leisingera sp. ANG-M1]